MELYKYTCLVLVYTYVQYSVLNCFFTLVVRCVTALCCLSNCTLCSDEAESSLTYLLSWPLGGCFPLPTRFPLRRTAHVCFAGCQIERFMYDESWQWCWQKKFKSRGMSPARICAAKLQVFVFARVPQKFFSMLFSLLCLVCVFSVVLCWQLKLLLLLKWHFWHIEQMKGL